MPGFSCPTLFWLLSLWFVIFLNFWSFSNNVVLRRDFIILHLNCEVQESLIIKLCRKIIFPFKHQCRIYWRLCVLLLLRFLHWIHVVETLLWSSNMAPWKNIQKHKLHRVLCLVVLENISILRRQLVWFGCLKWLEWFLVIGHCWLNCKVD